MSSKVKAFRGLIYNQEKINDLSKVVCPPYDIISPKQQSYFYDSDPYNFIRILLTKDTPPEDKYQKAGKEFRDWIKNGIFLRTIEIAHENQIQFWI